MTDLTFWEKYRDAFWRLAPSPIAVSAALAAVALHPSRVAFVALVLLVLLGVLIEVVIWQRLRVRWAAGLRPESVGQLVEPGTTRVLVLAVVLLFAILIWRAFSVADTTADAVIAAAIAVTIYGVAIAISLAKDRS